MCTLLVLLVADDNEKLWLSTLMWVASDEPHSCWAISIVRWLLVILLICPALLHQLTWCFARHKTCITFVFCFLPMSFKHRRGSVEDYSTVTLEPCLRIPLDECLEILVGIYLFNIFPVFVFAFYCYHANWLRNSNAAQRSNGCLMSGAAKRVTFLVKGNHIARQLNLSLQKQFTFCCTLL